MSYYPPEPCMCGADDCRLCRPFSFRDDESDDQDEEMTVGLDCCPHHKPYGSDCDDCDEDDADGAYELNDPKHSGWIDRALSIIDHRKDALK